MLGCWHFGPGARPIPFNAQLAIQGGGAKLTLLLAAAQPVQRLIADGELRLTRVVGTSAGAIVAALLAANIDVEAFRRTLLARKPEILAGFKKPGMSDIGKMLLSGTPIWPEDLLRDILEKEFGARRLRTILDVQTVLDTELQIVSTNLAAAASDIAKPDDPVVHALLNSCGLPIAFHSWSTGPLVDGGVTQNFAWQNLAEQPGSKPEYGPVLGIMFDREPPNKTPNSPMSFCLSLLNSSIDSATERARQSLGKAQIFSINPTFGTFDIEDALGRGLDGDYHLVKEEAKRWFQDFLADPEAIRGDIWSGESLSTMTKTARMYKQQHSGTHVAYKRCAMIFHAHGLAGRDKSDSVQYHMEFQTLAKPVFCHKLALSQSDNLNTGFLKSSWALSDKATRRTVEITHVPMLDETTPTKREVLAYFHPVLDANTGPYVLKVSDSVLGLSETLRKSRRTTCSCSLSGARSRLEKSTSWFTSQRTIAATGHISWHGPELIPASRWISSSCRITLKITAIGC